jgi:hypothetical protein
MNINFIPDQSTEHARIRAIRTTLFQGGGTFDGAGRPVDISGFYVVGGSDPSVVIPVAKASGFHVEANDINGRDGWVKDGEVVRLATAFDKFVRTHRVGAMVGTWLHEGKVHFDVVQLVTDREKAENLGRERGEIAIFDGTTFEDITL